MIVRRALLRCYRRREIPFPWALVLALLVCLSLAAPAGAAITASNITDPPNGTELFFNGDNGAGSVTVRGTVTGATASPKTFANLVCYTLGDTRATTVVSNVDVSSG